jgi:hypothetical protein
VRSIYLDHNIVHYLTLGFPEGVDLADEHAAIEALKAAPGVRFIVSMWNIAECVAERQAVRLTEYLSSLAPLWASDRLFIEKHEVQDFVFGHYYGCDRRPPPLFNEYVSQMCATLPGEGQNAVVGESFEALARSMATKSSIRILKNAAAVVPRALTTIQEARAAGRWTKELQSTALREWIADLIPLRDPDDQIIPPALRQIILSRMTERKSGLFDECTVLNVHDFATEFRTKDPKRKPERQDAIDLMHWIVGVGYCDAFVTAEKYLLEASRQLSRLRACNNHTYGTIREAAASML